MNIKLVQTKLIEERNVQFFFFKFGLEISNKTTESVLSTKALYFFFPHCVGQNNCLKGAVLKCIPNAPKGCFDV